MEIQENYFSDIGSLDDFIEKQGLSPGFIDELHQYSTALSQRRLEVAAQLGMRVEDLRNLTSTSQVVDGNGCEL